MTPSKITGVFFNLALLQQGFTSCPHNKLGGLCVTRVLHRRPKAMELSSNSS